MLNGVTALVAGHSRRRNTTRRVDAVAQIDGHIGRIKVIGKLTRNMGNLYIVDIVVTQHLGGHLGTGHTAREWHLRIFGKDRLQASLNDISDNGNNINIIEPVDDIPVAIPLI